MSEAASLKRAAETKVSDITNVKRSTSRSTKDAPSIANNPFFQVMTSTALTPEEKVQQIAKAMGEVRSKEENRERVRQLAEFAESEQTRRKELAQAIIDLTNTETFAQLQQVYSNMNNGLLDFNEAMAPILEIIDAMHTVRKEGKSAELFEEIRNDRIAEEDHNSRIAALVEEIRVADVMIANLNATNNHLREERSFFGFGGVKSSALDKIASNSAQVEIIENDLREKKANLSTLRSSWEVKAHENEEYEKAKRVVRNMLDLSADSHRENQKRSIAAAQNFINVSDESLSSVRVSLLEMNGQIDRLMDANTSITGNMAILGEGLKIAERGIQDKRSEVDAMDVGESMVKDMQKKSSLRDIDEHATMVSTTIADTSLAFADLGSQTVRITTMKDANTLQLDKVSKMHTQGVAGVADRLSVTLTAVGQAATGESSAIVKDTLALMTDATNSIAHKESVRVALGANEINEDIIKAMTDLEEYGEILRNTTEIRREAVIEMRSNLDQIGEIARNLQLDINDAAAIHSDTTPNANREGNKPASTGFGF